MNPRYLLLAALVPLTALGYPIELEKRLNGAELSTSTQDIDRHLGGLQLHNHDDRTVHCKARFSNGPEAPRMRQVRLQAGESSLMTARFSRDIIKLRIRLECQPEENTSKK